MPPDEAQDHSGVPNHEQVTSYLFAPICRTIKGRRVR